MEINDPVFLAEWEFMGTIPFQRRKICGAVFKRAWKNILNPAAKEHPDYKELFVVKKWLLTCLSFWSIPCDGMAGHVCKRIEKGERLDPDMLWKLKMLQLLLPGEEEHAAILIFERIVERGAYEELLSEPALAKLRALNEAMLANPTRIIHWEEVKELFDIELVRDSYGMVRRTPSGERNNPKFKWDSNDPEAKAQMAVDLYCAYYTLFAVAGEYPLIQKPSINPAPVTWNMTWPRIWPLNAPNDFAWRVFAPFNRARATVKHGPKISSARVERRVRAVAICVAWDEAGDKDLQGDERTEYVLHAAGLPPNTSRAF